MHTATTGEDLCDVCAVAEAESAPEPAVKVSGTAVLRQPGGRARAAVALLALSACAGLFSLYSVFPAYGLLRGVTDLQAVAVVGSEARPSELDDAYRLLVVAGGAQILLLIVTAAVFIGWFRVVRANAEVLAPHGHRTAGGWALRGWFVPVANLWIPRRLAADIWDANSWEAGSGAAGAREGGRGRALLNAWWAFWVAAVLTDRVASRYAYVSDTAFQLRRAIVLTGVAASLYVVAAVLAVLFVRRLTRMQEERALRGPAPAPVGPVPA